MWGLGAAGASRAGAARWGAREPGDLGQPGQELEEQVRQLRGQLDVGANANRQLAADVEKLRGDMDFRLQQLEGGGRAAAPRPPQGPAPAEAPAPQAAHPPGPRTAERALADGQAALARRDYDAAEAAAREVIAGRPPAHPGRQPLLARRCSAGAYQMRRWLQCAYQRNRQSSRAPEALLGLANSFAGFNARRESCETLDQLRVEFPRLTAQMTQRVAEARRRAQCR